MQLAPDGRLVTRHDSVEPGDERGELTELADVIELCKRTGLDLLLDVKPHPDTPALAAAVAGALPEHRLAGSALTVSSFDQTLLEQLRVATPWLDLVPIVSLRQNFLPAVDPSVWPGLSLLAAALLANPVQWHRLKTSAATSYVWFGATEWRPLIHALGRIGVDVLIVDDIQRALAQRRH